MCFKMGYQHDGQIYIYIYLYNFVKVYLTYNSSQVWNLFKFSSIKDNVAGASIYNLFTLLIRIDILSTQLFYLG